MALHFRFRKINTCGFLLLFAGSVFLTGVKGSEDWIIVSKKTRDPVFVSVGQNLKLKVDVKNVQTDKWNTTVFWVFVGGDSEYGPELDLQLVRSLGSDMEKYYSYNITRISRERRADLVIKSVTLADSGVYRCKFRRPPHPWSISLDYRVIIEESGKRLRLNVPQIVYLARGDTLKLEPTSIDSLPSSYGKKYGTFWDFSPSSLKAQESEIRIIDSTFKRFDVRASLEQNGTVLILTNTTLNDSGVYHLRIVELYKTTLIHKEFHVIVEEKPVANMHCPRVVRLRKGDNFFCLCEGTLTPEVAAQASWLQHGKIYKHLRPFHEEELYLKNITAEDAGIYTCRVRAVTVHDETTLEIIVLSGEEEMAAEHGPSVKKRTEWLYLGASLGVGLFLGMVLVFFILAMRRKCRKAKNVYEDVSMSRHDLRMDNTEQHQATEASLYHRPTLAAPYDIPDVTSPVYMDMSKGCRSNNQASNRERFSLGNGARLLPGYTDLDNRDGVDDSHPYQGLQPVAGI